MLSYLIDRYKIQVSDISSSAQNPEYLNQFDSVYIDADEYLTSAVAVKIYGDEELIKSSVFGASGGYTGVQKSSMIVDVHKITGCCCDTIFCLSVPELNLLWKTKADITTCFQIFKYQQDYIVHGEVEISRINEWGAIVWQKSGADIFVRLKGSGGDFLIADSYIFAKDWENREYKFDFDGNIID